MENTNIKYAIYIRKSTDEKDKQVRSIEDQLKECQDLAKKFKLNIVDIISENKSAKIPNKRNKFNSLIKRINKGEINGIVSWAPDRLSRNMLEAGNIIQLLSENKLVDMKFCAYQFDDSPYGRMLLNISFTMAAFYSEKLSQDVFRGNKNAVEDGKALGMKKLGYTRNEENRFVPDGNNFKILQGLFKKRLSDPNKYTIEKLATIGNNAGFVYSSGERGGLKLTMQKMDKILKDSFYYGLLVVKHNDGTCSEVNLNDKYDFKPVITKDQYDAINKTSSSGKLYNMQPFPFKGVIKCNICGCYTIAYTPKSCTGKRYLMFECKNHNCVASKTKSLKKYGEDNGKIYSKKSIRGASILNEIKKDIEVLRFIEPNKLLDYIKKASSKVNSDDLEIKNKINILNIKISGVRKEYNNYVAMVIPSLNKLSEDEVRAYEEKKNEYKKKISDLRTEMNEYKSMQLDFSVFTKDSETTLNFLKQLPVLFSGATPEIKNKVVKIMGLNYFVEGDLIVRKAYNSFFQNIFDQLLMNGGRTKS